MSIITHPHPHTRIVERSLLLEWATQKLEDELRTQPEHSAVYEELKEQIVDQVVEWVRAIGLRGRLIDHIRDGINGEGEAAELEAWSKHATVWFDELLDIVYAPDPDDGGSRSEFRDRGVGVIPFPARKAA